MAIADDTPTTGVPVGAARAACRRCTRRSSPCCWRCCSVLPFLVYPVFAMKVLCFALFAAAFNLLLGFGGLLSFGHAAFFGGASYVAAHAAKVWGFTPELAILTGTAAAALLGLVIGALAIRRQGIYFAMVTLAFAQMVYFFALQAAVHRRRGRHPVGAARRPVRPDLARRTTSRSTSSCSR